MTWFCLPKHPFTRQNNHFRCKNCLVFQMARFWIFSKILLAIYLSKSSSLASSVTEVFAKYPVKLSITFSKSKLFPRILLIFTQFWIIASCWWVSWTFISKPEFYWSNLMIQSVSNCLTCRNCCCVITVALNTASSAPFSINQGFK